MTALRRLAYATLGLAYALIVFGAIVRITGSGMGCGNHWPLCNGALFPPMNQPTLVIEWTHRLLAAIVVAMVAALVAAAFVRRREAGVGGRVGVLNAALLSGFLILLQATLGMVTVRMGNSPGATVAHLLNGALLLAALTMTVLRAGGLGGHSTVDASATMSKSARGAAAAAAVALTTVLFGGLTAKIPGANSACAGFPLCGGPLLPDQHTQLTHRLLAFLLFFHVLGLTFAFAKRRESPLVLRTVRIALGLVILQIVIAAGMVQMHLPPAFRSAHEATGIALWISLFALAWHTRYAVAPDYRVPEGSNSEVKTAQHRSIIVPRGASR